MVAVVSLVLGSSGLFGCAERAVGGGSTGESETGEGAGLSAEDLAEIAAVESELEMIIAGTLAYYAVPTEDPALNLCPHPNGTPSGGEAGFTPPLEIDCNAGPGGKCVPTEGVEWVNDDLSAEYSNELWTLNSVWVGVGWSREEGVGHEFHYNLEATNDHAEDWMAWSSCSFVAIARADFDGDGVFSRYSISGVVDAEGATIEPMVVEMPYE